MHSCSRPAPRACPAQYGSQRQSRHCCPVAARGRAMIEHIEVRKVTRLFGATPALRAVSARFDAGSITFLEGPNGAGKSTLLAVIGTVLAPTSGEVVYHPLGSDLELVRPHLGWV